MMTGQVIARAAKLSLKTETPVAIPPLLLVDPPGVGKTFFARRLAGVLGSEFEFVSGDLLSDRGCLTGLSLSWKAARPGRIANALLNSSTPSPVILMDEVDKVSSIHPGEKPLSFLHSTLEIENARTYRDEYLTFAIRADQIVWIMTANSIEGLEPSILDRVTILHIEEPTPEMSANVVKNIYAGVNARFGNIFDATMLLFRLLMRQLAKPIRLNDHNEPSQGCLWRQVGEIIFFLSDVWRSPIDADMLKDVLQRLLARKLIEIAFG